ncbi:uracil-DNA glycosylase family protein [Paraburkholderia tagetis]|uniref:Uracil-DNA glycosylase family protein n=1 Tax=Paraburkholderia tagetis TaxID=2913261 RepID=A0A9X1ZZD6_9BURK|nr:uracil-DNA glycosylase family protein [Paraburkholderia tagetis]MCG5078798.1 uracil-DNA glycosylase family protein [Paraburkholderia tagetis]
MSTRIYNQNEVDQILECYRNLFPEGEITPALAAYWDFGRRRVWSDITTNFHTARYTTLLDLHSRSCEIVEHPLTAEEKGETLRNIARDLQVGFSLGVCPWTDNLLLNTFDPLKPKKDLVVIVGHDWYPIGAGVLPESPLYDQGLHHTPKYRRWCPESFFRQVKNDPVIFFMNLYPDFRPPEAKKTGPLPRDSYSYTACMEGLREVLGVLKPKFDRTSIISWGKPAWEAISPLIDDGPIRHSIKVQQKIGKGRLLSIGGTPYFPMAHPSFSSNQDKEHLRIGFDRLHLGLAGFDLALPRDAA